VATTNAAGKMIAQWMTENTIAKNKLATESASLMKNQSQPKKGDITDLSTSLTDPLFQ